MNAKTIDQILSGLTALEKSKLTTKILKGEVQRGWMTRVINVSKHVDLDTPYNKLRANGRHVSIKAITFDLLRARFEGGEQQ